MSIRGIFPIDKWDFKSESILANLMEDDYNMLTANSTEHSYGKGETIFKEGFYPTGIYYIKKGKVKKYKAIERGGEQIIYVANTGELIGYHAILSEERFPDSAATLEDCIIDFIPKEDFLKTLQHSTILNSRLLKTLSHEFTVLANRLALLGQHSVRERLALQLIVLREKYKQNFQPGMSVEINLSREDLANFVGTARENVVRILSEFKDQGILSTKGRKIVIHDINKLIELTNFK
ncbi:Crp/Fnr family transcriptional regulator [Pseudobacter ginsenosidimutans]|uniref:CRP-like cAMP-binding protein n=1 Tax=Pseudobacter ginsenosidimutans TaxID=661488 RepID=A0A4Q7N115_9BACT|nr:Crp/Fnr family transcriptional regulator [Pseudobacter ginsenosidimutans]QEC43884.1 Crp/Fnr family transcriptional regulator [Pseudobacter ginsenosidimutans]RZS75311.1 CRP-like cAMP-binding protein [Pseudobacter ginsenosidimutans]